MREQQNIGANAERSPEFRALETLRGDWDADGTSIPTIPQNAAYTILSRRGWTTGPRGEWVSPEGAALWHTDEALSVALLTEALS